MQKFEEDPVKKREVKKNDVKSLQSYKFETEETEVVHKDKGQL